MRLLKINGTVGNKLIWAPISEKTMFLQVAKTELFVFATINRYIFCSSSRGGRELA